VLVGRWGDDLVYRLRTRAVDLLLRPPAILLPGALARADTGLVEVAGRFDPDAASFIVSRAASGAIAERVVPLSAQWGWSLLMPFPHAHGDGTAWLTAAWLFVWMLPLGYWALRCRPAALAGGVGVLAVGLAVVPLLFGLKPGAVPEWLGGVIGLAIGAAISACAGRAAARGAGP
jgi:hypothetical protein